MKNELTAISPCSGGSHIQITLYTTLDALTLYTVPTSKIMKLVIYYIQNC